jgi:hypothetical protein
VAAAISLAACGQLLGIDPVGYAPADAAAPALPHDDGGAADVDASAPDAPGTRFCDGDAGGKVIVCDDFDGVDFAKWTGITSSAGPLVRDTAKFVSPPSSLLAAPPASAGGLSSILDMAVPLGSTTIAVEATLLVEATGTGSIDLLQIEAQHPAGRSQAALTYVKGNWQMERQDPLLQFATTPTNASFGTWKRVRIEWTLAPGSSGSATITVEDAAVAILPFSGISPSSLVVRVGVPFLESGATPWRVRFDDVRVTVR